MQKTAYLIKEKAKKMLAEKQADSVIAWQSGQFYYDNTPACFDSPKQADSLVWNSFCGSNLSKYLVAACKENKKTAILLKPCDSLSFNQLLKDNRIVRDKIIILGVTCTGMLDINKLKAKAINGILSIQENENQLEVETLYGGKSISKSEALLEKCLACKKTKPVIYDELIGGQPEGSKADYDRFADVRQIEAMSGEKRFEFWQKELSKCIRCNACREVCPACNCEKCIFDNKNSALNSKANSDSFEEQLFHIIRAYHIAGRCTDCGECARVCPEGIPLHLINRKFIKDINVLYGEYQAGADVETLPPLLNFRLDDVEAVSLTNLLKGGDGDAKNSG